MKGATYYKIMVFQVQILGVGGYFTQIHNYSSFVIHADGEYTLIDCPDALPKIVHEANQITDIGVRLERINHVILTHLHGDHANGLEGLGFFKKFLQGGEKPVVYSTREVLKDLWSQKLRPSMKRLYLGLSERIGKLSVRELRKACKRVSLEDFFVPVPLAIRRINRINNLEVEIQ